MVVESLPVLTRAVEGPSRVRTRPNSRKAQQGLRQREREHEQQVPTEMPQWRDPVTQHRLWQRPTGIGLKRANEVLIKL
jgi:hypothetical protein